MESVLIVDDARIEREGIRDNIDWAELGIDRVEIAADGQQALQLIEQTPPSILLTDICMPFMDGLDLCKATRSIDLRSRSSFLPGMMNSLMPNRPCVWALRNCF